MDIYKKIIDNPLFAKWVFNPNPELNAYWKKYATDFPQEQTVIKELSDELKKISVNKSTFSVDEKQQIANRLIPYLKREQKKFKISRVGMSIMRYAAVALLFSCASGLWVYFSMKDDYNKSLAEQYIAMPAEEEAVLYLSDQRQVKLEQKNSSIYYSQNGDIVLNEDSVINDLIQNEAPIINRLVIPYGDRSKIILSDSTVVWLNAGSQLIYPSFFADNSREVTLFGEALFEVSPNKTKPFVVKTSMLDIRVLGTVFNISAYPEEEIIQTVLKEGKVAIRERGSMFYEKDIILKPSQMATLNKKTKELNISRVNVDDYTIWTDGLLSFFNADLSRIIKKVERYYNIRIVYDNPLIGSMKISGKLNLSKNKQEVFQYLSQVSLCSFEEVGENIYKLK